MIEDPQVLDSQDRKGRPRKLSNDQVAWAVVKRKEGMRLLDLIVVLGVSKSTIRAVLRENGITARPQIRRRPSIGGRHQPAATPHQFRCGICGARTTLDDLRARAGCCPRGHLINPNF